MERDASRNGRRKLLVASIGVATVSYALLSACGKDNVPTTGNLPAPPPTTPISGNLMAQPEPLPVTDAGSLIVPQPPPTPITGNLPAPPPRPLAVDGGKPKTGGK